MALIGRDIAVPWGDVRPTTSGDWPVVEGNENLRGALVRRASAGPGELVHQPTYGAGAEEFVESLDAPVKRAELIGRLRENLALDGRLSDLGVEIQPGGVVGLRFLPRGMDEVEAQQAIFVLGVA